MAVAWKLPDPSEDVVERHLNRLESRTGKFPQRATKQGQGFDEQGKLSTI